MELTNEIKYNILAARTPMLINRFLSQQLKQKGIKLTREQWSVLAVLWKNDGCSQQYISESTHREKSSITRLIDNLERDGYVERQSHKEDRRLNLVFLTSKGAGMENEIMNVVNKSIEEATKGIDTGEIKIVIDCFEKIYHNIKSHMN